MKKILAFLGIIFLSFLLISCVQKTNDSGKVPEKTKTDQPVKPNEGNEQGSSESSKDKEIKDFLLIMKPKNQL